MRSKFLAAASAVFAISLLGATGASAATEAGSGCVGNETLPGTAVGLANGPTNLLPATIPSGGVITRWRMSVHPLPPGLTVSQAIKIFRPTPATELQVIGESAPVVLVGGTNDHTTRIPVQAGDHIGGVANAEGQSWGLVCKTGDPDDRIGIISGNPGVGATTPVAAQASGYQVPIVVSVEPDADNDGFGDETQDGCPQNAASQAPCPAAAPTPALALSTTQQVRKGSVTIAVTASTAAPVSVLGVVKLGKGKKATLNGGTQSLAPGVLGKFTLKFTKKVRKKLKALPRKRSLRLDVTVSGGVSGAVTTSALKINLKGQAKPPTLNSKR